MKISLSMFVNVVLTSILVTSLAFMTTTTSSAQYDPWADYDESGLIDIFDIVKVAIPYGTSGDPTKNVTVVNWPMREAVSVWWQEDLVGGSQAISTYHYAEGFSTLHVLVYVTGLGAGEEMEMRVISPLYNPTRTSYYPLRAYSYSFTSANYYADITINVPTDVFYFIIDAQGTTSCTASLSFWLTWA